MAKKIFIIDGSGFIFRAFHALPPLKRSDGVPVGAVYGFCNMILQITNSLNEEKILVVFDAARKTFRQDLYPDYKAHRPPPPDDLVPQFSLIRKACYAMGIPHTEQEGFEADDLIASYAKVALREGYEVVVVSSDKDLTQLIKPGLILYDPLKKKHIDEKAAIEKFGVLPSQIIDVQALAGDSSDNIPGIPGIGIKTAALLIQEFKTLESLLDRAHEIKQLKRRESLINHKEKAILSKKLVTLVDTVPLPLSLEHLIINEKNDFENFLKEQGFKNLLQRFFKEKSIPFSSSYETITDAEQLEDWYHKIYKLGIVGFDTETTSLSIQEAQLVGFSLAIKTESSYKACYVPLAHKTDEKQISVPIALTILEKILKDKSILKVGHNLKYDQGVLRKYDLLIHSYDDTMLMSYCLDAGKNGHSLDELAAKHFNHQTIKYADVVGSGKQEKRFDEVSLSEATPYAAEDALMTLKLYEFFKDRLIQEKKTSLYAYIEKPLISGVLEMEKEGISVDTSQLKAFGVEIDDRLRILESLIYQETGEPFNLASPKQLGEILFNKLSLPGGKKSKTGQYTTDSKVLESLSLAGFTLAQKILDWRSLAKLKSTYVEGLLTALNPNTGKIHTSFSLVGTVTGRLSSSQPNLQNIPIKTPDGRRIRKAFIASEGKVLLSCDYSQIELRLLAHMAAVSPLITAFKENKDIHKITASQIFNVPLERVDNDLRRKAKTVNFGLIYGISAFGLSQQLKIERQEAQSLIDAYFKQYPGIQTYMRRMVEKAQKDGFVETLWGRRCYTPFINDKQALTRQFAERQAINAPLQGSSADIIKMAMNKIYKFLQNKPSVKMILQVHDELIFEGPEEKIKEIAPSLKKIMEQVTQLKVPLIVDIGIGLNWDDAH